MHTITIAFLDSPQKVTVEAPLPLRCSWGDRVSRTQDAPVLYGSLAGAPYRTPDDLCVEVGQRGHWWERNQVSVRGLRNGYEAELTDEQRAVALKTYALVADAWRNAVRDSVEIASAVEGYRRIQDGILRDHEAHEQRWSRDVREIARRFRRKAVEVGEQTVPGKCCVRSSRGNLLGYALIRDGRWTGHVEAA